MSRISFILLPVLILTAFASFVPPVRGAPASFTPTATNSRANTPTSTPSPCSISEKADFTKVAAGRSVEGAGLLAHDLNIDAAGTAVKILAAARPVIYSAHGRGGPVPNGGIAPGGGFSDIRAHTRGLAHHYTFTFPPTVTICNFSLHMLDFGDFNPSRALQITLQCCAATIGMAAWSPRKPFGIRLRRKHPPQLQPIWQLKDHRRCVDSLRGQARELDVETRGSGHCQGHTGFRQGLRSEHRIRCVELYDRGHRANDRAYPARPCDASGWLRPGGRKHLPQLCRLWRRKGCND